MLERTQKTEMKKSKLVKLIGKISTIIFIILFVVNLWLDGKNSVIEITMWMFGCDSILWIIWTTNSMNFKKQTKN